MPLSFPLCLLLIPSTWVQANSTVSLSTGDVNVSYRIDPILMLPVSCKEVYTLSFHHGKYITRVFVLYRHKGTHAL